MKAGDFLLGAIGEITAPAEKAGVVLPAVPADSYALALLPRGDAWADLSDYSGYFVAGTARIRQAGPEAIFDELVAEANAAGLHADADLAWSGLRDFAFLEFEVRAGFGDDGDFHFWHLGFP
jgi:hypothetical protein